MSVQCIKWKRFPPIGPLNEAAYNAAVKARRKWLWAMPVVGVLALAILNAAALQYRQPSVEDCFSAVRERQADAVAYGKRYYFVKIARGETFGKAVDRIHHEAKHCSGFSWSSIASDFMDSNRGDLVVLERGIARPLRPGAIQPNSSGVLVADTSFQGLTVIISDDRLTWWKVWLRKIGIYA
jgi:hypothetical protein